MVYSQAWKNTFRQVMNSLSTFALLVFSLMSIIGAQAIANKAVFNIRDFGARGDGRTDDMKAVTAAWNKACSFNENSTVLIPLGTFLVSKLVLPGPCKGSTDFELQGVLKAPENQPTRDAWITFNNVKNLNVVGRGTLDGQGAKTWPPCRQNSNCIRPMASLVFDFVSNSRIQDITSIDSKFVHIKLFRSDHIDIGHVTIKAPDDSPNTDGINMGESTNINVFNSNIGTGDDCISLLHGSRSINISGITCGPGHGISIGSLGSDPKEMPVNGVKVTGCTFTGTMNGARIKTRSTQFATTVSNITFEHLQMNGVSNPIIVDQHYCPSGNCNPKDQSHVQIRDVQFNDIRGTSRLKAAVSFQCSSIVPCQNFVRRDISLLPMNPKDPSVSSCSNIKDITYFGKQMPPQCEVALNDKVEFKIQ